MENELRQQIVAAFANVPVPKAGELIQPTYAKSEDAMEMAAAFRGKHWSELPISVLSYHREIIIALSGPGYRAYLPAYLMACLADDEVYGPEIRGYVLYGLRPLSDSEVHVRTARERLSLLDVAQREAIAAVVRYLRDRWHEKDAAAVLADWYTT